MDTIHVQGLSVHVRIGCTEAERAFPQRLVFDIDANIGTWQGQPGKLSGTVCYATLASRVRALAEEGDWLLVEELAEDCCKRLFDAEPLIKSIRLRIYKFAVPGVDSVGVSFERLRPE